MSSPTFDKVSQKSQRTQIHFLSDVFLFFRGGGGLSFSRFFFGGGGAAKVFSKRVEKIKIMF